MYTAENLETRPSEAFEAAFINLPRRHVVLRSSRDITEPLGLATPMVPSSVSMAGVFGRKNAYVTWRNPRDAFVPMIFSVFFLVFTLKSDVFLLLVVFSASRIAICHSSNFMASKSSLQLVRLMIVRRGRSVQLTFSDTANVSDGPDVGR